MALEEDITFDCLPNSIQNDVPIKYPSVNEEIERCRILYDKRQVLRRQKAIDIKPLYYDKLKERDLVAKYPVYKFLCIYPKAHKTYDPCQHIGQIIIDRDILTKDEHISFLAQPKRSFQRSMKAPRCIYQRRFLPNCTTRINSLAHPKKIRVQHNWQDFHHLLSVRQATNLRRTLQRPPVEYTSIENALTYIHEERRLKNEMKNESIKRCDQIKRKLLKLERQHITKIIFALFEIMKEFLMTDQFVMEPGELSSLSRVLEMHIIQFCGFDSTTTSHVQHLMKTVAQNLAIWIEKFTANCGFRNSQLDKEMKAMDDACKPMGDQELLLPVDDFIPYQSPTMSDLPEAYLDAEEYAEAAEYDG